MCIVPDYKTVEEWHLIDKIKIHKWLTKMLEDIKKPQPLTEEEILYAKNTNKCPRCKNELREWIIQYDHDLECGDRACRKRNYPHMVDITLSN